MMAKWLTDVAISDVDGGELGDYHLLADLMFEDDKGITWTTPKGFVGDLSSFPWFVRVWLPKTALAKAPWPHDYGYRHQPHGITRQQWDEVYRQGAIAEGMKPAVANTLYAGLRAGGGISWAINRRRKKQGRVRQLVRL